MACQITPPADLNELKDHPAMVKSLPPSQRLMNLLNGPWAGVDFALAYWVSDTSVAGGGCWLAWKKDPLPGSQITTPTV